MLSTFASLENPAMLAWESKVEILDGASSGIGEAAAMGVNEILVRPTPQTI